MELLGEVFDVQTKVDDHLLTVVRVPVRNEERARDARHDSVLKLQLVLNILVSKEGGSLQERFMVFLLELFDHLLAQERVMDLRLLVLLIETHGDNLLTDVNVLYLSNETELVKVQTDSHLLSLDFTLSMVGHSLREAAQWVSGVTLPHHQAERQHVRVLPIGLIEAARVIVELNTFDPVAGDKHVDLRDGTEDALAPQRLVHMVLPLLRCSELFVLHKLELVGCNIAVQSENREFVLKIHSEGLLLEWETDKDVLARLAYQSVNEFLKFLGLSLLDTLGHHDKLLHKRNLLHDFVLGLQSNHIQVFERRVARRWVLDTFQEFGLERFRANILVLTSQLTSRPVHDWLSERRQRALENLGRTVGVILVLEELERNRVSDSVGIFVHETIV